MLWHSGFGMPTPWNQAGTTLSYSFKERPGFRAHSLTLSNYCPTMAFVPQESFFQGCLIIIIVF